MLFLRLFGNPHSEDGDDGTEESTTQAQPPYCSQAFQSNFAVFRQIELCAQGVGCAGDDCSREILNLRSNALAHLHRRQSHEDFSCGTYCDKQAASASLV